MVVVVRGGSVVRLNPTVVDIVEAYLREHDYDGLYSHECSCDLDDLMGCLGASYGCRAGHRCAAKEGDRRRIGPKTEGCNQWEPREEGQR